MDWIRQAWPIVALLGLTGCAHKGQSALCLTVADRLQVPPSEDVFLRLTATATVDLERYEPIAGHWVSVCTTPCAEWTAPAATYRIRQGDVVSRAFGLGDSDEWRVLRLADDGGLWTRDSPGLIAYRATYPRRWRQLGFQSASAAENRSCWNLLQEPPPLPDAQGAGSR